MERGFEYLTDKHGPSGAREIFENICISLFQQMYGPKAKSVAISQGDGGIDVLIGDLPSPDYVYQCKYFTDRLGSSQKQQIIKSFQTVVNKYKVTKWALCLPMIMNEKELLWWSKWKDEQKLNTGITIELCDGSYLLTELKKTDLYTKTFDDDIRIMLETILKALKANQKEIFNSIIYGIDDIPDIELEYNDAIFVKMLESANIEFIDDCKVEFFNAEISIQESISKDESEGIRIYNILKQTIYSIWKTQYNVYKHPSDGNNLLNNTYLRIEDLNSSTLQIGSNEYSLLSKKGILHHLANDKKIGWIENYLVQLTEYMEIN